MASFDGTRRAQMPGEVPAAVGLPRATARRALLTLLALGYAGLDGRRFNLTPLPRSVPATSTKDRVGDLTDAACHRIGPVLSGNKSLDNWTDVWRQ